MLGSDRLVSIQESRGGAVSTGLEGMLIAYGRVQEYRAATASLFESLSAHRLESWNIRMVPVGRLREGVGRAQAAAAVDAVARSILAEPNTTVRAARVDPLSTVAAVGRAEVTGFFAVLLGMALLVLLIAAANIAGVMLSRGFARRREMAVRLAIGAGRSRVVRHLLAESLLIFALGGLLGVGLAHLGTAWLAGIPLPPQLPPVLLDLEPDLRVLAFAAVVTGTTGVVFGLVPALKASRPDRPGAQGGHRGVHSGRGPDAQPLRGSTGVTRGDASADRNAVRSLATAGAPRRSRLRR
jgi:hypothetical protein